MFSIWVRGEMANATLPYLLLFSYNESLFKMKIDKNIELYLKERLSYTMEWYKDCVSCEKTFDNIRKDINSIVQETCAKFSLKELPFLLKLDTDNNGKIVVVKAIDKNLN